MKITSEIVKEFALGQGASLVGIAYVERFADAPEGHRKISLMVRAQWSPVPWSFLPAFLTVLPLPIKGS